MFIDEIVNVLREAMGRKGYAFFESGDYNLNLIGVRSSSPKPGHFDDVLVCLYKVGGLWRGHVWPITTDPGAHYLKNPINAEGTAILVPGQYRGAYVIGTHKGYKAFVQHGAEVKVWRDRNKDTVLNWGQGPGEPGWYGINIHRAKEEGVTDSPDSYSAGCQVFAVRREHDALMELAEKAKSIYGDKFTYTLLEEGDL